MSKRVNLVPNMSDDFNRYIGHAIEGQIKGFKMLKFWEQFPKLNLSAEIYNNKVVIIQNGTLEIILLGEDEIPKHLIKELKSKLK